jgi:hypothetical protein
LQDEASTDFKLLLKKFKTQQAASAKKVGPWLDGG